MFYVYSCMHMYCIVLKLLCMSKYVPMCECMYSIVYILCYCHNVSTLVGISYKNGNGSDLNVCNLQLFLSWLTTFATTNLGKQ